MSCASSDCSFLRNASIVPAALQANPDISGIGVLIGFVGTAYITFLLLVLRYMMGSPEDFSLSDGPTNPVDKVFLKFIWRKTGKPPERWAGVMKTVVLALSDTQICTGLSILASAYSQIKCGLSIYHWHIAVFLAWFSSATHITTLSFLQRYIHDNSGIQMLRLVLMGFLVVTLAVALIPTGGACGLQTAGDSNTFIGYNGTTPFYLNGTGVTNSPGAPIYPGTPVKCCFELMRSSHRFISSDHSDFLAMLSSEVLLISSSITRALKVFRGSSVTAKQWLRHKPARVCKRLVAKWEMKYNATEAAGKRRAYLFLHCAGIVFIVIARAIYDSATSNLFEILWLLFSLAWGTMGLIIGRGLADQDSAVTDGTSGQVILQENYWAFGQWAPTLLLLLPLLSVSEAFMDKEEKSEKHTPSVSRAGSIAVSTHESGRDTAVVEASRRTSSTRPEESEPAQPQLNDQDLTRSNTHLNERSNRLSQGTRRSSLVNQAQPPDPDAYQVRATTTPTEVFETSSPLESTLRPWPAQTYYDHNFNDDPWYQDLLIVLFLLPVLFALQLILATAGAAGNFTIIRFFTETFQSWDLYVSILLLFYYAGLCMTIERSKDRKERLLRSLGLWFPCLRAFTKRKPDRALRLTRWWLLICILVINFPLASRDLAGLAGYFFVFILLIVLGLRKRKTRSR